jgi:hypothetical protein
MVNKYRLQQLGLYQRLYKLRTHVLLFLLK